MPQTSLAVVEPHLLIRSGFALILDAPCDFDVVGQAADLDEMMALLHASTPDVVCIAARFSDGSTALDAIDRVNDLESYDPVLILLTGKRDLDLVEPAKQRGVAGTVSKYATPEDIVDTVRTLALPNAAVA